MKRLIIYSVILFQSCECVFAQSSLSPALHDSLFGVWSDQHQPDSVRAVAFNKFIRKGYVYSRPDSAYHYAKVFFNWAKAKGSRKYMAAALNLQAIAQEMLGKRPLAVELYGQSLKIYEGLKDRPGQATCLGNMGIVLNDMGQHAKAIDHHLRSIRMKEELGDRQGMASGLSNLALVYHNQGDYVNGVEHHMKSLRIKEELKDKEGILISLVNIGDLLKDQAEYDRSLTYLNRALPIAEEIEYERGTEAVLTSLGEVCALKGDLKNALGYYRRCIKLSTEIGNRHNVGSCLGHIGTIHQRQGEMDLALEHFQQGLRIFEEFGDSAGVIGSITQMGHILLKRGEKERALAFGKRALKAAEFLQAVKAKKAASELLFKAYKAVGNHRDALEMHVLYIQMRDSMASRENQKEVMRQQFQYDYDKQEALMQAAQEKKDAVAAEQLRRKNQQRNAFIGGFALMFGLAGVSYRSYRNKKKDNAIITKEKARSEELLLNILPHEVAEELKEKGEAEAKLIENVTVLFTDFKGFTQMSEVLSPKELVRDLNECFSAFDRICEKYGIEKIKTIGDAYMAAGGLPTPNSTHAQNVVKAALEMAAVVAQGKAKKQTESLPFFEIRIGIHTGPVVAGIVGIKKFQYDIWGDTVNTASRMESSGEVGKVNISQLTYELVKDQFACEYRGEVEAKGKGKMGMYFVSRPT